ncbi:FMN-binding protein [Nocardioides pocheonensis]|uniref:FMN-binding protein n=1 Tax=Nocardioides pocheonensis TaxID=661485 RepID=A0A3N0GMG5_9ACTN|nr:FMN-binding protein [Nocardioides pocheonensis]RNM13655.1 FMN-binding protein [Nocardioides pocheonensis]
MRRIVLWFMSTLTVVVLLFGYHTSTSGPSSANSSVVSSGSDGYSGSSGTASSGSTSDTSGTSGSASGSSGSSSSKATSVTGDTAQTQWGPVQVEITVSGGRITAVDVPVYPSDNPRDQEINSYALPQLIQETLDQQSANIDMVSGATVTSDGYLQSLQSALDQAGL